MEIEVFEEKRIGRKKNELVQVNESEYKNEEVKYFSREEYISLLDSANGFYKMVYLLFFETGARVEEARSIKFCDVDFSTGKIKINTLKQRNKIKYRILVISDSHKSRILQHKDNNSLGKDDYILTKLPGRNPITQQGLDKALKADCRDLEIDILKAHCHTWRHTRAIQLLDSGMDIVKVKMFLGHSNIQNTLIYLRYSNKDFVRAIIEANKNIM